MSHGPATGDDRVTDRDPATGHDRPTTNDRLSAHAGETLVVEPTAAVLGHPDTHRRQRARS